MDQEQQIVALQQALESLSVLALKLLDHQQRYFKAQPGSKEKAEMFRMCKDDLEPQLKRDAKAALQLINNQKSPTLF